MKKNVFIAVLTVIIFWSCSEDKDDNLATSATVSFNFSHDWDGENVTNANFNTIQYTNANGEMLSIEKLRYLISDVTFENTEGENLVIEGYNLVDVTNNSGLTYAPNVQIPTGVYNVSFTFGFDNEDNYDHSYPDLNTALWNVPEMMGGGYHYMQLEGKFIDNTDAEVGYAYHTIRAVNMMNAPDLVFQDTFFEVDLGEITIDSNTNIQVKMNIAEWFKNPNQWDLNVLNNTLMPNFDAQVMMNENGQTVFSLGAVSP